MYIRLMVVSWEAKEEVSTFQLTHMSIYKNKQNLVKIKNAIIDEP